MSMAMPSNPPADCGRPACTEPETGSYFVSTYPPFSTWTPDRCTAVYDWLQNPPDESTVAALGLYVHIPFCAQRCLYCYYLSYADRSADGMDEYVDRVIQEFSLYRAAPALCARDFSFVYFGGGTPSLLTERQIARLLEGLPTGRPGSHLDEATFECAPKSVTAPKLRILRDWGITRISMGIQELNDDVLRSNGRIHLVNDAIRAYDQIRQAGFDLVNLDLIAGLPGQTDASFLSSLDRVIALQPDCVTIYLLEIPHNTPLFRQLQAEKREAPPASWDVRRARAARGFERLEAAGYALRSGYTAVRDPRRHRFIYQDLQYRGADLLGIGTSAFSFLDGIHAQNLSSREDYSARLAGRSLPLGRAYVLTEEERLIREFILQLKLGSVDAAYFQAKFGVDIRVRFAQPLSRLQSDGLLRLDDRGAQLTRIGLLQVDRLLSAFYLPMHQGVRYS